MRSGLLMRSFKAARRAAAKGDLDPRVKHLGQLRCPICDHLAAGAAHTPALADTLRFAGLPPFTPTAAGWRCGWHLLLERKALP
jgi:hypothetical protein